MITGEIRNKIDQIWDAFWAGGIASPISVIEQMTYLLFIKGLDEAQARKEKQAQLLGGAVEEPIFPGGKFTNPVTKEKIPYRELRWSRFKNLEPRAMHSRIAQDVFPFIKTLGAKDSAFAIHMKDAIFMIPPEKAGLLARVVDMLDEIPMEEQAAQGPMQTQGEVLEQDFEQRLRQAFPIDRIEPVLTGARGADIAQHVISRTGQACGCILIDTKRTKSWQDAWTAKLRGDMRTARADIGLIVTETLPKDIEHFGMKDGVWVTDFASALPLVHSLRVTLQEVTLAKGHREGAKEKMELLYEYLTGNEFRQRVQLVIEAFRAMKTELDKERTYLTTKWNKREKQINLVIESMAGMVGDVQALSGGAVASALLIEGIDEEEDAEVEAT